MGLSETLTWPTAFFGSAKGHTGCIGPPQAGNTTCLDAPSETPFELSIANAKPAEDALVANRISKCG